jgi:hypothetical protein
VKVTIAVSWPSKSPPSTAALMLDAQRIPVAIASQSGMTWMQA